MNTPGFSGFESKPNLKAWNEIRGIAEYLLIRTNGQRTKIHQDSSEKAAELLNKNYGRKAAFEEIIAICDQRLGINNPSHR